MLILNSQRIAEWWRRPLPQVLLCGFVLLCSPGMFDALQGIGGGGSQASNQQIVAKANSAVYGCYAAVGLFSGVFVNRLGVRFCLSVGCLTFGLYVGSMWSLARTANEEFVIFAGCMMGFGAAFLWGAQGVIVMSYPLEAERARYFSYQYFLLTLGACIGGFVALADTIMHDRLARISDGTYAGFVAVVVTGTAASLLLSNPTKILRNDGTRVHIESPSNWREEFASVGNLFKDRTILLLLPTFLSGCWYYAYHFSLNAYYFSLRGRSLNGALYWAIQPVGSFFIGSLLDMKRLHRRTRAIIGFSIFSLCTVVIWTGGALFQANFDRTDPSPELDWTKDRVKWGKAFALWLSYGFLDSLTQTYTAWILGTRTNDLKLQARYSGIYKGIASAGQAISFGLDAGRVSYRIQFILCFVLMAVRLPFLGIVAWNVGATNYGLEKEVAPPNDWEKAVGNGMRRPGAPALAKSSGTAETSKSISSKQMQH